VIYIINIIGTKDQYHKDFIGQVYQNYLAL
jgi:hypothetical protein